jgi:transposase
MVWSTDNIIVMRSWAKPHFDQMSEESEEPCHGLGQLCITICPAYRRLCAAPHKRRGFDGLASLAQNRLSQDPFSGHLFVYRGRRGDLIKVLWWDGQGLCLFAKRLEKGRFVWPQAKDGAVFLTPAQLSMLLEGIDWRMPARTWRPEMAG